MIGVSTRGLLLVSMSIGGLGLVGAFISAEWGLLAIITLSLLVQVAIWFRQGASRVPVALRSDLARQLELQSERSGEPFEAVLDRAVAAHHHRLYGDDGDP